MDTNKRLEQFEAWARSKGLDLEYRNIPGVGQFYECPRTLLALEAWQASREAVVVELPYVRSYPANEAASDVDYYLDEGRHDMKTECRKAIEAQGLKVAP